MLILARTRVLVLVSVRVQMDRIVYIPITWSMKISEQNHQQILQIQWHRILLISMMKEYRFKFFFWKWNFNLFLNKFLIYCICGHPLAKTNNRTSSIYFQQVYSSRQKIQNLFLLLLPFVKLRQENYETCKNASQQELMKHTKKRFTAWADSCFE